MSSEPYLFLDVDGIQHGTHMKYGFEQTHTIVEKLPTAQVHPAMRPQRLGSGSGELPDWVARRRGVPETVTLRTRVRTSPLLRADLAGLGADIHMLTSWLEHDSVDAFYEQTGGAVFPYTKLCHPSRLFDDPVGAVPASWKFDELTRTVDADPRPFIWADDDEVPVWREEVARRYPVPPHLLIAPDYSVGLTRHHIEQMQSFMASVTGR